MKVSFHCGAHVSLTFDRSPLPTCANLISGKWKHVPNSLVLVTLVHNKKTLGKAVLPRLFQMGFTFAQPFLVQRVIEFIQKPDDFNSSAVGTGLILSYMIVYVGIAISTSLTQHWTVRLATRMRAGLVDLVYRRTLEISCPAVDEADAVTLMSADVERITTGFRSFRKYMPQKTELLSSNHGYRR